MKKEVIDNVPQNEVFNATDLMEKLIQDNKNVVAYPLVGYWLDIGKHDDFEKAQALYDNDSAITKENIYIATHNNGYMDPDLKIKGFAKSGFFNLPDNYFRGTSK